MLREAQGSEPTHVIVLATLGAPQRRFFGGRRAQRAEPEPDPTPVPTGRATVISAQALSEVEGQEWLGKLGEEGQDEALAHALANLNQAIHSHRLAAADHSLQDLALERALVARIGYGTGDQVAEGRWDAALEVPLTRRRRERRVAALRPQERLAALLGGRDEPLACELLVLRARADLDAGRTREAALQLRVALEAGLAELEGATGVSGRLEELREARGDVGAAANAALQGPLDSETAEPVARTLSRLEAALRARSAAGFG